MAIPQTSEAAAQLLVSPDAQIRKVDVGQPSENHSLLRAFIRFDAKRIKLATREMRDRFGKAACLISGLKAMPESRRVRYTVTLDGEDVTCEGFTCLEENAGSIRVRGLSLAPNISVSDGLLDEIIMHGLDPMSLASALDSIADKPLDPDKLHHWQAKEFTIATDLPQAVIADGKEWGETPITMKALPGAARITAPGRDAAKTVSLSLTRIDRQARVCYTRLVHELVVGKRIVCNLCKSGASGRWCSLETEGGAPIVLVCQG